MASTGLRSKILGDCLLVLLQGALDGGKGLWEPGQQTAGKQLPNSTRRALGEEFADCSCDQVNALE